uniref:HAD family hydrolase n=1 Tax=Fervidicoccus fontis TaxID=683846 RepID=A0A7J3ZJB1_9CREN
MSCRAPRGGYRLVLFDLDGTLVDTMGEYARLAAKLLSSNGIMNYDEAYIAYLETAGRPFIDQLKVLGVREPVAAKLNQAFIEGKRDIIKRTRMLPITRQFLAELRDRGYLLATSTNNECELVAHVDGIDELHLVLCFDGAHHRKGRPHLETLKLLLGVGESEIVFVGDSEYDIQVYQQLHVHTIKTQGLFTTHEINRVRRIILRGESESLEPNDCIRPP